MRGDGSPSIPRGSPSTPHTPEVFQARHVPKIKKFRLRGFRYNIMTWGDYYTFNKIGLIFLIYVYIHRPADPHIYGEE